MKWENVKKNLYSVSIAIALIAPMAFQAHAETSSYIDQVLKDVNLRNVRGQPLATGAGPISSGTLRVVLPTDQGPIPVTISGSSATFNISMGTVTAYIAGQPITVLLANTNVSGSTVTAYINGQPIEVTLAATSVSGSTVTAYIANQQNVSGSTITVLQGTTPWIIAPTTFSVQNAGGSILDVNVVNSQSVSGSTVVAYIAGQPISVSQSGIVDTTGSTVTVLQGTIPWVIAPTTISVQNVAGSTLNVVVTNMLSVINTSRPDLTGLVFVYKSTDNMVVSGSLTLTGKANQVDLQAISNDCTFNIGGGGAINVAKNTAESYSFDYTAVNLVVNLTAKSGGATCKVRITGAN